jgi:hypothetical protein
MINFKPKKKRIFQVSIILQISGELLFVQSVLHVRSYVYETPYSAGTNGPGKDVESGETMAGDGKMLVAGKS